MNTETVVKGGITSIGTVISFFSGMFTPLFFILMAFEVLDYITGMIAAWLYEGWSSKEALMGALKKLGYFALVAVGYGLDYLIHDFIATTGVHFEFPAMFGILTMWFLLSTELISIVENLSQMGINVPFIAPALKFFRDKVNGLSDKRKDEKK